jgi:putative peptidoglycan lipid II flippase
MPSSSASLMRRITQSTGVVMASVLLSRVLGLVREWAVAHQVGSNAATDAYYAAFTLPDFLNYLVAGGSLSLIFIPVFSKYVAEDAEDEAWHVFSTVLTFMSIVLVVLIVAAEIWAPGLVRAVVPGFKQAESARAVALTRLMLPAQFAFYLGGVLAAVQYARAQFVVPSLAPLIYNLGIILGGLLLGSRVGITGFSVGVLAGAFVGNFGLQIYGARRAGARFRPNLDLRHPGFRLFLRLAIPIMLALSLVFADDWIVRWFGSYLRPASITWLQWGKTLMRVPLGVVGQAVGVASFPFLAQLFSERRFDELNRTLDSTLKGLLLLLLPISTLTMAESRPLVHLFFATHTRVTALDVDSTAAALVFYSIGMFAWGAQGIVARGFYAAHDTLTPAVSGTLLTLLNLPVYWLLVRRLNYGGLAIASSIGIIVYTVVLFGMLRRRLPGYPVAALSAFFVKVAVISTVAGFVTWRLTEWLGTRIGWASLAGAVEVLAISSMAGLTVSALMAWMLRIGGVRNLLGGGSRDYGT